jgi:hypothetical protein
MSSYRTLVHFASTMLSVRILPVGVLPRLTRADPDGYCANGYLTGPVTALLVPIRVARGGYD